MIKRLIESLVIKPGAYISIKKAVNKNQSLNFSIEGRVQEINQSGLWIYKSLYGYYWVSFRDPWYVNLVVNENEE